MKTPEEEGRELRSRIEAANRLVHAAEAELDEAVSRLRPVQIGDKGLAGEALDEAFEKLRAARALVKRLGELLVLPGE